MTSPAILNPPAETAPGGADRLLQPAQTASASTFLTILVAELQNQNPLEPLGGTDFITQLAQFNTLEQLIGIRSELKDLRREISGLLALPAGAGPTVKNH